MKTRRGSLLWSTTLGNAILMYKPGDLVKPVTALDPFFTGIVRSVDTKTNKITVAWGGGPESQHDADEIMPISFFYGDRHDGGGVPKSASVSRRVKFSEDVEDIVGEDTILSSITATNSPMGQYCGNPEPHGLNEPRGGGFSVVNDLACQPYDEANEFTDVNPCIASGESPFKSALNQAIQKKIRELRKDGTSAMSVENLKQVVRPPSVSLEGAPKGTNARYYYNQMFEELCKGVAFCRMATSGDEPSAQRTVCEETAKKSSVSREAYETTTMRSRRAMYWCGPNRTFRLTKQEQNDGMVVCPRCRSEMSTERFTRSEKLYMCPTCGFKIPSGKAVTQVEVKVPENVSVEVTHTDEKGDEVAPALTAKSRRGKVAYSYPVNLDNLPRMSISDIASVIRSDWKNVYFGAKPYLNAMFSLMSVSDMYGLDTGKSVVVYFLANANGWRGEVARAVKKELQRRIR